MNVTACIYTGFQKCIPSWRVGLWYSKLQYVPIFSYFTYILKLRFPVGMWNCGWHIDYVRTLSLLVQRTITKRARQHKFTNAWDEKECGIKSVLGFSLYFQSIKIIYISTYTIYTNISCKKNYEFKIVLLSWELELWHSKLQLVCVLS